jgi:hypothetical protein
VRVVKEGRHDRDKRQTGQDIHLPSQSDIAQTKELFERLEAELAETGKTVLMSASGKTFELPSPLFEVLRFVGATLASGNGVTVVALRSSSPSTCATSRWQR